MPDFTLTDREANLLHAALSADRTTAAAAWKSWTDSVVLEEAPHAELRLLPAVHANLSKVAPDLPLPAKLRGKVRATFTYNRLISHESLPALRALTSAVPIMVTKGAAFCTRFNAWSFRQTGDIDIHVRRRQLRRAVDILTNLGWVPKYGMTAATLKYRTPLRRNSWNLTKGKGDIDLHWRLLDSADAKNVSRRFWDTAESIAFFGVSVLMPSPEFSIVGSLRHGFAEGTRADALQALVDCWHLLPVCDRKTLAEVISMTGTEAFAGSLATAFSNAKLLGEPVLKLPNARSSPNPSDPATLMVRRDKFVIRHRRLYDVWERLGRRCTLERLILRHFGPLSRPLAQSTASRSDYDLRDCSTVDEIGGPGWGWPEPEHTCFWSDQADNRLLVNLPDMRDYVAVFSVSSVARHSPNPNVLVVVNGRKARKLSLRSENRTKFAFLIPRSYLFGPWIEISFRPDRFGAKPFSAYGERRCLPAVRLQIIAPERVAAVLAVRDPTNLQRKVDRGEEPYCSKFKRVEIKIRESTLRGDPRLPVDFDPVSYILLHEDLLNAEVDPYWHFIAFGKGEGRAFL
ncbi:MAG: nucleotidyltransferase family protein [Dongiaceae bacterium]